MSDMDDVVAEINEGLAELGLEDSVGDADASDDTEGTDLAADLRSKVDVPDDVDDAKLLELWEESEDGFEPPASFKAFIGDEPVDYDKVTLREFIEKEGVIEYRAMQQAQRRKLDEVVRNAQLGHLNAQKEQQLQGDVKRLTTDLEKLTGVETTLAEEREIWNRAMRDPEYREQLAAQYNERLTGAPAAPADPEREAALTARENEVAATAVWNEHVSPYLDRVAAAYNVDVTELKNYASAGIESIPEQLISEQRIADYLTQTLPAEIEAQGYTMSVEAAADSGVAADPAPAAPAGDSGADDDRIGRLEEMVANLKQTASVSKLSGVAPASGEGPAAGGAGSDEAEVETAADYREFLRQR